MHSAESVTSLLLPPMCQSGKSVNLVYKTLYLFIAALLAIEQAVRCGHGRSRNLIKVVYKCVSEDCWGLMLNLPTSRLISG